MIGFITTILIYCNTQSAYNLNYGFVPGCRIIGKEIHYRMSDVSNYSSFKYLECKSINYASESSGCEIKERNGCNFSIKSESKEILSAKPCPK